MANVFIPPGWRLPDRSVTDESIYVKRRSLLKVMSLAGVGLMGGGLALSACGAGSSGSSGLLEGEDLTAQAVRMREEAAELLSRYEPLEFRGNVEAYPAGRPLTSAAKSTTYNNAYEFGTDKDRVVRNARAFKMSPWEVEVAGLCDRVGTFDIADVVPTTQLEERHYRFRCVEAWSMTVPWVGMPMRKFIEWAAPKPEAKYLRFVSVLRPSEMSGQREQTWYDWPYYEGLRLDEGMNDLAMLVVGMYGRALTPQNGGPLRTVVPWKYGYKSAKYIVRIEFTASQPKTFWNDLAPREYDFTSNVDPTVPHPRWSQASERLIDDGSRIPTQPFNGYGEWVRGLYS